MDTKNKPRPLTEDQAAEQATTDFIKGQYPKMSDDMASLWARVIAAEENEGRRKTEMAPELRAQIQTARTQARETLDKGRENMIRRGFQESLKKNDFFEAMAFWDDAMAAGIRLDDLLENTPTQLDRQAIRNGEIPLSCIS